MSNFCLFLDVDGVLTVNRKILNENLGGIQLAGKQYSDYDSTAINLLKQNNIPIILISGDHRINYQYSKYKNIPFIKTPDYTDKYDSLVKYINSQASNFPREYYYCGNDLPDFGCLKNAKKAFIPSDASGLLTRKLKEHKVQYVRLKKAGGQGCVEQIIIYLLEIGELNDFQY